MTYQSSPPRLRRFQSAFFLSLSVFLASLWGWIDYQTESEVVLSIFYLIPVAIAAWYVHEGAGIAVSLLCAFFAGYDTEIQSGVFSQNPWVGGWAITSRLVFFLLTVWLVGRLRRTMASIRQMAMTDSLTGVYNARTFFDLLQKEMARSRRYRRPLSLVYLDVDNFKTVNDTLGHQTGNIVLSTVAAALRESVRRMDIVARMGGDEFSMLLPETGEDAARKMVERAQENLLREAGKKGWPVTVSIGVATFHCVDCTADDIIRKADDLMYQVKRSGKNGILYAVVAEENGFSPDPALPEET
jgi:diguanylate cyclase (GGDEF)-like protein